MYKHTPERKNSVAIALTILLFTCAGLSLFFLAARIGIPWIFQLAFAMSLIAGIQITNRYIIVSFTYGLSDLLLLYENNDFVIERVQGYKRRVICRLSLYNSAVAVIPKTKIGILTKKYGKITRHYNYCVNIFPKEPYYFIFEIGGEVNLLAFEPDDEFLKQFKLRLEPSPPSVEISPDNN